MAAANKNFTEVLFGDCPEIYNNTETLIYFGYSPVIISDLTSVYGMKGSALLVSYDNDYVLHGRKIKDYLTGNGKKVVSRSFENHMPLTVENAKLLLNLDGIDIIIAVGEKEIAEIVRYLADWKGIASIYVPINPKVSFLLSNSVSVNLNGERQKIKAKQFTSVIFDEDIYAKCRKQELADAYGEIVGKSITLIDYKIAVCMGESLFCKEAYESVRGALKIALNISNGCKVAEFLALAELKLTLADSVSDILNYGSQLNVSRILAAYDGDVPDGEREIEAFYKLIKLYKLYFVNDFSEILSLPDFCEAAAELAEIFQRPESEFIGKACVPKYSEIIRSVEFKKLADSSFSEEINGIIQLIPHITENYNYIFNSRKKLSSFTSDQLKTAVRLGAYLNNNISALRFLRDDGTLEYLK